MADLEETCGTEPVIQQTCAECGAKLTDAEVRAALESGGPYLCQVHALAGRVDTARAAAVWDAALTARWRAAPVWFHGDLLPGNLSSTEASCVPSSTSAVSAREIPRAT